MMNFGTFARNAKACENARHPRCTCACGGKLHGVSHAEKLTELWQQYVDREERQRGEAEGSSGLRGEARDAGD